MSQLMGMAGAQKPFFVAPVKAKPLGLPFSAERYSGLMINIILMTLSLSTPAPVQTAQVRPCVWPNTCKAAPAPVIAQVQTCVWPNRCVNQAPATPFFTL